MMKLIEKLVGLQRVLVNENQRAIVLHKGELKEILGPGEYLKSNQRNRLDVQMHTITSGELISAYAKPLFEKLPEIANANLVEFRTGKTEVGIVEQDGKLFTVMKPDTVKRFWKDGGPWTFEVIDTEKDLKVSPALMRRLGEAKFSSFMTVHPVIEGQVGLLYVDGALAETLKPGVYAFWNIGKMIQMKVVDTRLQSLDVSGQDILTKDRVTIRVNIAAEYQVEDPVKAATLTKDFTDALYRSLQYAFRKTLGTLTLDQILEQKVSVDVDAAEKVRMDMAELGVTVRDIALKDVILPGEMREILNQVVSAQKEAEANVIRRREETNATRSLLNTAKVMAENPVMLRLKELEALETISAKVDKLTINNGTTGLLSDVARLRDETS